MEKNNMQPVHARYGMAVASLVGFFASAYLFYTYVSGIPITCGFVNGCEAVRASKWAWTFGVPRPFLGLVFYGVVFGLLVGRAANAPHPRLFRRLTTIVAMVGFVESAFLFFVQWLDIRAFCLWCLISAVAATVIALLAPFDRIEERLPHPSTREFRTYFFLLLFFLPIAFIGFARLIRP